MFLFVNKLTTPRVLSASELLSNGFYMLQEPKPISDFELFTSGDKPLPKLIYMESGQLCILDFQDVRMSAQQPCSSLKTF